jgi:hypothetical protein
VRGSSAHAAVSRRRKSGATPMAGGRRFG